MQPFDQDQESARLLPSFPSGWQELTYPNSSLENLSIASTSVQLPWPESNHFPADQDLCTTLFHKSSLETAGASRPNCDASANGAGTSVSPESSALPASTSSFSDPDAGIDGNPTAVDQSSNFGARTPARPSKRRRKPGSSSLKHTEPLPCSTSACPKTFLRRCELT